MRKIKTLLLAIPLFLMVMIFGMTMKVNALEIPYERIDFIAIDRTHEWAKVDETSNYVRTVYANVFADDRNNFEYSTYYPAAYVPILSNFYGTPEYSGIYDREYFKINKATLEVAHYLGTTKGKNIPYSNITMKLVNTPSDVAKIVGENELQIYKKNINVPVEITASMGSISKTITATYIMVDSAVSKVETADSCKAWFGLGCAVGLDNEKYEDKVDYTKRAQETFTEGYEYDGTRREVSYFAYRDKLIETNATQVVNTYHFASIGEQKVMEIPFPDGFKKENLTFTLLGSNLSIDPSLTEFSFDAVNHKLIFKNSDKAVGEDWVVYEVGNGSESFIVAESIYSDDPTAKLMNIYEKAGIPTWVAQWIDTFDFGLDEAIKFYNGEASLFGAIFEQFSENLIGLNAFIRYDSVNNKFYYTDNPFTKVNETYEKDPAEDLEKVIDDVSNWWERLTDGEDGESWFDKLLNRLMAIVGIILLIVFFPVILQAVPVVIQVITLIATVILRVFKGLLTFGKKSDDFVSKAKKQYNKKKKRK